jgi:hypothetical protein
MKTKKRIPIILRNLIIEYSTQVSHPQITLRGQRK